MAILACPNCGAKNRVNENRASHDTPRCGKCSTVLPAIVHPVTITDANFATEVLALASVPVLVDCWASWCPPCRAIAPVIDELASEAAGRWKIGKLDVDANQHTAGQFRIESIPTLLIFKDGKKVDALLGAHPKPAILARLQKWA